MVDRSVQPDKVAGTVYSIYRRVVLGILNFAIALSISFRMTEYFVPDDQLRHIGFPIVLAFCIYLWAILGALLSIPLSGIRSVYMLLRRRFLDFIIELLFAALAYGAALVALKISPISG
jgi:hypothetical protein